MQTALPEPWRAALPDRSAPFCAELFPCTIFLRVVPGTTGRQYCIGTVRCSRKERLNVNNENQKRFVRPKRESGAVSQQGQNGQKQGGRKPAGRNPQKLGVKPPKANKPQQEQLLPVQQAAHKSKNQKKPKELRKTPVRIIPLGGLNEIGKNLTVVECANDMFLIDCGLAFPDSDMLGVDIVIPDFTYLERNVDKLRGVVLTHGHEDHIGGLAYLLKKINIPVYGTQLTLALVEGKLREHRLLGKVKLNVVKPRQTVKFGCMAVEFIRVNHSIPDAVGMAIHTPAGVIVHTGDFKVDYTPINGEIIDLARFAELGSKGVLALLSDSTNAERPGFTPSERTVGESFEKLFAKAEGKRIIIATFSSNIHRVQQIIDCAARYGRKVAIFGRSMVNVMTVAIELGYLTVPKGIIIDIDMMNRYESERIVLITTGSQGEPMSALTRMAMNDHKKVTITPQDFIIISATPIPGNEKTVTKVVNELMKCGAEVVYERMYEVHVSGHACQEETKLILALTKPKFYMPVHGEYKHFKKQKQLAMDMGIPKENIIIGDIGNVIETDGVDMKIVSQVPAGRVMVDGLGVGDVGSIVLRDRKHLAEDGLIIVTVVIDKSIGEVVAGPDMISRGFVYVRESEQLMDEARNLLSHTLASCTPQDFREWNSMKTKLRDALSDFIFSKTKRSPMILPIISEIH
ncbi:ribonuclease J [Ruminococcus champanellensis]|uniref:ribonuclease J n=1 Tax=Ruminococcus champanellensis TaxID=1161942 RepID=UPI002E78B506|nr:ribonuclease J [Ruminococcus champanellensis]MED9891935.1 ribonuclease J [Ruminococcus champanellensis]